MHKNYLGNKFTINNNTESTMSNKNSHVACDGLFIVLTELS